MFTAGIGGDSHLVVDDQGALHLGPTRVVPLCMVGTLLPPASEWLGADASSRCIGLIVEEDMPEDLEDPVLTFLRQHGLATPAAIGTAIGLSSVPLEKHLEGLARDQLIFETGFTPTDALHVLGHIAIGNQDAAINGAAVPVWITGREPEVFCQEVLRLTEKQIEDLIIDYIIHRYWGKSLTSFISSRDSHPVLGVQFSLKIPLIGIGAASRYFLPGVAKRLATTVSFPEHCEVGNAVGAALLGKAASALTVFRSDAAK